jgi:hypothetical protein
MASRLRVNRPGYAMGGVVGGKVTLPEIQQEVAQNRSSEQTSSQREASNVNVAILDSEQAVMRFLESSRGQRVIHSMIDNRTRRHG